MNASPSLGLYSPVCGPFIYGLRENGFLLQIVRIAPLPPVEVIASVLSSIVQLPYMTKQINV